MEGTVGEKVKWSGVLPWNCLVTTTVLTPSSTVFEVILMLDVSKVPGSWSPSFLSSTLPLGIDILLIISSLLLSIDHHSPGLVRHGKVRTTEGHSKPLVTGS